MFLPGIKKALVAALVAALSLSSVSFGAATTPIHSSHAKTITVSSKAKKHKKSSKKHASKKSASKKSAKAKKSRHSRK